MKYDYLVVGYRLFGATFAYRAKQLGYKRMVAAWEACHYPFKRERQCLGGVTAEDQRTPVGH